MGCAQSAAEPTQAGAGGLPPEAQAQGGGADDDESEDVPRLLLVSDNLPDYEVIIQSTAPDVVVVAVKYEHWTLDDLKAAIIKRAGEPEGDFDSVGIFDHGAPGEFCLLKGVKGGSISLADTLSLFGDNEVMVFLKWLTGYVDKEDGGRIDLLGCCVGQGARGEGLIAHLEKETGVNWAASTDETGAGEEADDGLDFVMETEAELLDVVDLYFEPEDIAEWLHVAKRKKQKARKKRAKKQWPRKAPAKKTIAKKELRGRKKRASGYVLFAKNRRHELMKEQPNLTYGEVRKLPARPLPSPRPAPPPPSRPKNAPLPSRSLTFKRARPQLGKELGKEWRGMSDAQKAKYK